MNRFWAGICCILFFSSSTFAQSFEQRKAAFQRQWKKSPGDAALKAAVILNSQAKRDFTENDPRIVETRFWLAECYRQAGQLERAIPCYQFVADWQAQKPENWESYFSTANRQLFEIYRLQKRDQPAREWGRKWLALLEQDKKASPTEKSGLMVLLAEINLRSGWIHECEEELRDSRAVLKVSAGKEPAWDSHWADLQTQLFLQRGNYADAEKWLQTCLAREGRYPGTALVFLRWADLERRLCRFSTSEDWLKKAETRLKKQRSFETLNSLYFEILGDLRDAQGFYARADACFLESASILENLQGKDNPALLTAWCRHAEMQRLLGNYREAEEISRRALQLANRWLDSEHTLTASAQYELASAQYSQGRFGEAEPLFQQALAAREKRLGGNHLEVANSCYALGVLYFAQRYYDSARFFYQRALEIRRKHLGENHPETAVILHALGALLYAQAKNSEDYAPSQEYFQTALGIWEKQLGPEHPYVATVLDNLGILHYAVGEYSRARREYERSLAIREKTLGNFHYDVAGVLDHLARLHESRGAFQLAEPLYQRALAIRKRIWGGFHPETAASLYALGSLYFSQNKFPDAEYYFKQNLRVNQKVFGPETPETAASFSALGLLYFSEKKYLLAENFYKSALAVLEKKIPPDPPRLSATLSTLAVVEYSLGKKNQARRYFSRSLSVGRKIQGTNPAVDAQLKEKLENMRRHTSGGR